MAKFRGDAEQSRERQIALLLLLQEATKMSPITREEILRDLEIDEYPVAASGPKKIPAYEGEFETVRQKFERDKARIERNGFEIETVALDDGRVGYYIDPTSGYAPAFDFTPEEEDVVRSALAFCGFGSLGAFSAFNDGPALDGGVEMSFYYAPIMRAIHLKRAVTFDYHSASLKTRMVEPLTITVYNGAAYLVAKTMGTDEIKGYRFNRMTSMPTLLPDTFSPTDEVLAAAAGWMPSYQKAPQPVDVVFVTNENYATLITREYPDAVTAQKKSGKVEVGISFDSFREAMRFVLEAGDRIRLSGPRELKEELREWLAAVNVPAAVTLDGVKFHGRESADILGQTLQLMQAVRLTPEGLRISELARRFSMAPELVRYIMDRLTVLQPMVGNHQRVEEFPAHIIKDADDWDDPNDDSTYYADFADADPSRQQVSELMWHDLFELNIALREASRLYQDPAIFSAIEKIEAATTTFVQVETAHNEAMLGDVKAAINDGVRLKIEYTPGVAESSVVRTIQPTQVRVLNGHSYVRAYCFTRNDWRTFRVDRINAILAREAGTPLGEDPVVNWLTQVGATGADVTVIVASHSRWLFETLPGAQWATLKDGRHAVKFKVADDVFLDNLMLRAGAAAFVAEGSSRHREAGHDLAAKILETL